MTQIRQPLAGVQVRIARGRRTCHRNRTGHEIAPGGICLTFANGDVGVKNYCRVQAADILDQIEIDLANLRAALHTATTSA